MRCATCGYPIAYHDLGTKKCPPETADKNGRRGTFKVPGPPGPGNWREVVAADFAARRAAVEVARAPYEPPEPPQVAARPPSGPSEVACYQGKQMAGLGRRAIEHGWTARALYWRSATGVEGCGVWLAKNELRAVATWKRKAGSVGKTGGWETDTAHAWRADAGRFPSKLNHTDLEGLIE